MRYNRISRRSLRVAACVSACAALGVASSSAFADYNPRESFAPFAMPAPVNAYRSASGVPGPAYWQNEADYEIHASLDPETKGPSLSGSEVITYTNNSPDRLDVLWLQLDQNMYKANSRSTFAGGRSRPVSTDGFVLDKVEVDMGDGHFVAAPFLVSDTRMRVTLPEQLKGKGGALKLRVAWHFAIPGKWGGRMAWGQSKKGPIYDLAQWYPRMAVYDDVRGWDTAPYLAQEFYLEYGNFDYYVTVPSSMMVFGSGDLVNPQEVLTKRQQERLAKARTSDATVMIRSPEEVSDPATRPKKGGTLTWHYHMNDTRDVAFTASSVFAWDAARINLPEGKTSLAMSVYPVESQGKEAWGRSTEYLKNAVENFSKRWFAYPWPVAINVAGPASGMEYPGIVFDGINDKGKELFWITAHEIGHGWFPMIVGFDERRDAWMDEGFNTFIDTYESDDFNHGEYGPKRDSEYAEGGGNPVDEILPILQDPQAPILLSRSDTVIEKYRHAMSYFKSALGLRLLREQILGPDRFDPAFRRFIKAWAFKHPKPSDFFRAMESEGGEDLSYFWNGWYAHNWTLDLAVDSIAPVDGDPAKGTLVTVGSHDKLVLPATLRVRFADGSHEDFQMPAESWIRNTTSSVTIAPGKTVVSAEIDPDHALPDTTRANNLFKVAGR
ncbi:M1 family metallopeptidase [Novosphingobium sp. 1949]|uniref:M1 family metallopeptidase n=1 Tax=Novosphingobium organovorum TaxID=2930092 RepID=A0ABT0BCW6_9SPHN|nr:M1 family metallopeptidase [Novosphingobium organovorum]MCJ2182902.1 M1 family metallopeptidase [Novosphingobium organovorum]